MDSPGALRDTTTYESGKFDSVSSDFGLVSATVTVTAPAEGSRQVVSTLPWILATQPIADAAKASGISVSDLGKVALRSIAAEVSLDAIELASPADPAWIDPVRKMRTGPVGRMPWLYSPGCKETYLKSPQAYPLPQ